ncbi:hypothetical protein AYI70_g3364 [Smittium culicis]|uniref:Uncharacterized protein n=1 Tax=Smittium culicis TaxID=133412 RepID=A0A1R1Y496_9FUNG|nr:hypothetical protein AYI70_g3364 [Smittium culicis]
MNKLETCFSFNTGPPVCMINSTAPNTGSVYSPEDLETGYENYYINSTYLLSCSQNHSYPGYYTFSIGRVCIYANEKFRLVGSKENCNSTICDKVLFATSSSLHSPKPFWANIAVITIAASWILSMAY